MLTPSELTDARRFCGYPIAGATTTATLGPHYLTRYGALEFRLANLSVPEEDVLRAHIAACRTLEAAIPDAAEALDTASAAAWTRNPTEIRDRTRLFDDWRRRLSAFLGVPPGPALATAAATPPLVL